MIRRLLLAALLLPSIVLAADVPAGGPASRIPRPPKREAADKEQLKELFLTYFEAGERGDADAAADLHDFPILVVTDGAKGEAATLTWTREKWLETLAPVYDVPLRNAKITHKAIVVLVSDALATVGLTATIAKDGKTRVERNSAVVVRKGGEWRIKAWVESGWSDVVPLPPEPDDAVTADAPSQDVAKAPAAKDAPPAPAAEPPASPKDQPAAPAAAPDGAPR